jgi:hypothetical protein
MKSQLPEEKRKEIDLMARRVSRAYKKYAILSAELEDMIQSYVDGAVKRKNIQLINELIDLTSPCDKNGQPLRGEFLGRLFLYVVLNELKQIKK